MTGTPPAIPNFAAGYGPLPADMNTLIQTPFIFLTTKIMFRAQLQAATALTSGTATLIPFGTTAGDILEDPYAGWSNTTTGSQAARSWLCPAGCTGWYEITMTAFTANPAITDDLMTVQVWLDGVEFQIITSQIGANGHGAGCCGSAQVQLIGGVDYVQMYLLQEASINTGSTNGQYCTMEIAWVSS